jgi:hypothetical protein
MIVIAFLQKPFWIPRCLWVASGGFLGASRVTAGCHLGLRCVLCAKFFSQLPAVMHAQLCRSLEAMHSYAIRSKG